MVIVSTCILYYRHVSVKRNCTWQIFLLKGYVFGVFCEFLAIDRRIDTYYIQIISLNFAPVVQDLVRIILKVNCPKKVSFCASADVNSKYFKASNSRAFRGFVVEIWNPQNYNAAKNTFFSLTAKLKCRRISFSAKTRN